jgi:hypothetical protein
MSRSIRIEPSMSERSPISTDRVRRGIMLASFVVLLAVAACGSDSADDDGERRGRDGGSQGPNGSTGDGGGGNGDAATLLDGQAIGDSGLLPDGNVAPPSFCQGIVHYASLDTGFAPEVGGSKLTFQGNATANAVGKFGAGVALPNAAVNPGAVVAFEDPNGGALAYPDVVGTVSLWYRGSALESDTQTKVLFAPQSSSAPMLVAVDNVFGVVLSHFGAPAYEQLLTFGKTAIVPYVDAGKFNHFVTGWRRGPGSGPTALFAVNGGLGTQFTPDPNASTYMNAQPTPGGDLLVPYRGYTSKVWNADANSSTTKFWLGGTSLAAPRGEIDDVAIWNRVLSFDEVAAVYNANMPVWQACKLR